MIKFKLFGIKFSISFLFLCLICWFLQSNSKITMVCLFSSFIHELFHIIFLFVFSVNLDKISFTVFGITIKRINKLSFLKESIILLSGCFANLILILIFTYFKIWTVVFINFIILIFNIIPFSISDGGQFLQMVLDKFLSFKISFRIGKIISDFFIFLFLVFLILLIFYFKSINFIFVFILLFLSFFFEL